jgi:hypothetical protein
MAIEHDELPAGTILETDDELRKIREQLLKKAQAVKESVAAPQTVDVSIEDEQIYRPSNRPPVLMLTIYDDGETNGEVIRVRDDRFTIGRAEGDLRLPHDDLISGRHVAFTRQVIKGKSVWVVNDLQSRNGLFVRVSKAPLQHLGEFLIGSGRYRLEAPGTAQQPTAGLSSEESSRPPATLAFGNVGMAGQEVLTEVLRTGIGSRYVLDRDMYWIGRDRACDICRANDPYLKNKHACLKRSERGNWSIQQTDTLNGIWLKIHQLTLAPGKGGEFQIGEQRFRLKVR